MNKQPNYFDFDESNNGFQLEEVKNPSHNSNDPLSKESIIARKKQLQRLLIILMGIGLSLGLVLSIGLVILLNKLGLTKKPYQLKQQKQQPVEQIRYHHGQEFSTTEQYVMIP